MGEIEYRYIANWEGTVFVFVNTLGAIIRNLRNLGDGLPFGIGATIPLTLWGGHSLQFGCCCAKKVEIRVSYFSITMTPKFRLLTLREFSRSLITGSNSVPDFAFWELFALEGPYLVHLFCDFGHHFVRAFFRVLYIGLIVLYLWIYFVPSRFFVIREPGGLYSGE